ncbi:MAG: molybdenum cofactor biosynthesis protein MoaE [Bacteroidia bacterium]|nr:molybdenum cofactor biosynthesis protein MoaE [Bacteroidia bacterium]
MDKRRIDIQILDTSLSVERCREFITRSDCGAEAIFVGTVRDHTKDRRVTKLEFEAYTTMAILEMEKIALRLLDHHNIHKIAIHHRIGILRISEIPVIIAVSAPHRKAAFAACEEAIDTLKETVPIWKKEFFEDGSTWVAAHP